MPTTVTLDTAIDTANTAKSIRELSQGLRQLVALQAEVGAGSSEFHRLQTAINQTEGRIGDLNDSFQTLRGSGVERVNSSLSLFREGLLNADTDKLQIALQGLGSALKALPIFLIVQGLQYLYENFDKVKDVLVTLIPEWDAQNKRIKENIESLQLYDKEVENGNKLAAERIANLETESQLRIDLLKREGKTTLEINQAIVDAEATKVKELRKIADAAFEERVNFSKYAYEAENRLKKDADDAESKATVEHYKVLLDQQNKTNDAANSSERQQQLLLSKIATENQDYRLAELAKYNALVLENQIEGRQHDLASEQERYRLAVLNAKGNNEVLEQEAIKHRINMDQININYDIKDFERRRALEKKQLDEDKQTYADIENELKKHEQAKETIEDTSFISSIEQGKREFAIEQQNLTKSLDGRIQLIQQKRDEELAKVKEGSDAALIIEQNANEAIFQEKLKSTQKNVQLAQQYASQLQQIASLITQNENTELNYQRYAKDAEVLNDQNRTQEALDQETLNTNIALNNASLTADQRAQIAYDSETRQRKIKQDSANAQYAIQQDFSKKELALRRQQFERTKTLQLITGAINTAAAVLQTLAETPYPANIPLAIAVGAAGAAQIAIIASQRFDDGGAGAAASVAPPASIDTRGGPPPSSVGTSAPNSGSSGSNPAGTLLGQGDTTNGQGVKVFVLESDIRNVTSKVDVLESRATFGA